jgi:hypothetical protein
MTRGYRNNNPGNIRLNPYIQWEGQIDGEDQSFVKFQSMSFGIRALMKLLINYQKRGFNTISKIINRYAPPSENNTSNYIGIISRKIGISKDSILNLDDPIVLQKLTKAIISVEIGNDSDKIPESDYSKAILLLKDPKIGEFILTLKLIGSKIWDYWYIIILIPVILYQLKKIWK